MIGKGISEKLGPSVRKEPGSERRTEMRLVCLGNEKKPSVAGELEKGMPTHSSILAWRITWTEEPGGRESTKGHTKLDVTEQLTRGWSTGVKGRQGCTGGWKGGHG